MSNYLRVVVVLVSILGTRPALGQAVATDAETAWTRVDALAPGTKILVTLDSGERRTGWFLAATPTTIRIAIGKTMDTRDNELSWMKSHIREVKRAPVWRHTAAGTLAGGSALFGLIRVSAAACQIGCDYGMPAGADLAIAGIGAAVGGVAGFIADRSGSARDILFPAARARDEAVSYLSLRGGPLFTRMSMQSSSMVGGTSSGAGAVVALQLSRVLSVHGEYLAMRGSFAARPGTIDPTVLANVVPAASRGAGLEYGIEHVRLNSVFSEMIGIHPWTWSRVRMELLGGVAVQATETFSYYDAGPGKFKVLNFASPDLGAVFGVNAEIAVARHFAVTPMVRYHTGHDHGPSLSYTAGAMYRL